MRQTSTSRGLRGVVDAPPKVVLDNVPRFSSLPAELRVQIWKYVSFQPRNVGVDYKNVEDASIPTPSDLLVLTAYYSTSIPPSILHACQESRIEGLKYYTLSFGHYPRTEISALPGACIQRIYLNWQVDTIWPLHSQELMLPGLQKYFEEQGLQRLAINISEDDDNTFVVLPEGLKELIIYHSAIMLPNLYSQPIIFNSETVNSAYRDGKEIEFKPCQMSDLAKIIVGSVGPKSHRTVKKQIDDILLGIRHRENESSEKRITPLSEIRLMGVFIDDEDISDTYFEDTEAFSELDDEDWP